MPAIVSNVVVGGDGGDSLSYRLSRHMLQRLGNEPIDAFS